MLYRFKEVRPQFGKSVEEVAAELGVSESSVRNWNNGYKKPLLDLLIRLADLYGVTTDYHLGRSVPSMPPILEYEPVSLEALPTLHEFPVWDETSRLGLVNTMKHQFHFLGGKHSLFPLRPNYRHCQSRS